MVLNRQSGVVQHDHFYNLGSYLKPGDLLVLNETRVLPARLYAHKLVTRGKLELLLLRHREELTWEVLAGGKGLNPGLQFQVDSGPQGEIVAHLGGSRRLVRFSDPIESHLESAGHIPLPPYIHSELSNPDRYQTVYARQSGSAAAPTAGLHFTQRLMSELKDAGIEFATVLLHVGLDTFAPVTEADPEDHAIHTEWCQIPAVAAAAINQARRQGGKIIAVGTTSVRTLESAAREAAPGDVVAPIEGPTDLYILPGYRFNVIDGLITNFHLPKSTLIMLVCAFAGRESVLRAYETAKETGYRFYSFGDAMLIL